jgi:hypothetical protein
LPCSVTVDFGSTKHYWYALSVSFNWGTTYGASSNFIIEKYYDQDTTGGCDTWSTVDSVTGFSGTRYVQNASLLGNHVCKIRFTFNDIVGSTNTIHLGELAAYQFYYQNDGPMVKRLGDTMYGGINFSGVSNDITTSNTEHLALMPGGNVGIGTASPNKKLHIYSTSPNAEIDIQSVVGAGNHWGLYNDISNNSFKLWGGADYLTVLRDGKVGIGTTNPAEKLHIDDFKPILRIADSTQSGVHDLGVYAGLSFYSNDSTGIGAHETAAIKAINTYAGSSQTGELGFYTGLYNVSASEKMRITSTGNVGIGTTGPGSKLHTYVSSSEVANTVQSGSKAVTLFVNNGSNPAMYWDNSSDMRFAVTTNGVASTGFDTKMVIKNTGNVGIGTTNPGSYKLYVNGDTNIDGTLTATSFVGPVTGTLNAANVSSGAFGGNTGGGNYSFSGKLSVGTTSVSSAGLLVNGAVEMARTGLFGTYNSSEVQGIWTIGNGYQISTANNDFGSQYGIVYAHTNAGTTGTKKPIAGWGHQILFTNAGNYTAAISLGSGNAYFGGVVGIGTTMPDVPLEISGSSVGVFTGLKIANTQSSTAYQTESALKLAFTNAVGERQGGIRIQEKDTNDHGGNLIFSYSNASGTETDGMILDYLGNVGIGTTDPGVYRLKVAGDVAITGTLQTQTGSDFAEEFSVLSDLEAGTVVTMAEEGYKSVRAANKAYDSQVVGIVSDNPSIIAGRVESEKKVVVAMMGVVSVKVSDINGEVRKGDLLTSSSISGYAMKAVDYKPGTIIGKALEDLAGKSGNIKVLVNLQ